MNPKTLCDQNTKEQLAEMVVELEANTALKDAMEQSRVSQKALLIEKQNHEDTSNWALEQQYRADVAETQNAELNKYLKHARDDKEIRLKEIEVLEAKIVELREMLQTAFEAIESLPIDALGTVPDTATEQGWPIREELLSKLHYAIKETPNENPQN